MGITERGLFHKTQNEAFEAQSVVWKHIGIVSESAAIAHFHGKNLQQLSE